MTVRIIVGDALEQLRLLPAESVHVVVTSPPYYGLRSYGSPPRVWGGAPGCEHLWGDDIAGDPRGGSGAGAKEACAALDGETEGKNNYARQMARGNVCTLCGAWRGDLGLEPSMGMYLDHMVEICREIRRVLRADRTFWLNISDSYASSWGNQGRKEERGTQRPINGGMLTPVLDGRYPATNPARRTFRPGSGRADGVVDERGQRNRDGVGGVPGLKPKDLMMIPARLAIRLQEDGWWLRQDIIWNKPNPMPESVQDRCTKSHEYIFMLSKSEKYYFDNVAIAEEAECDRMRGSGPMVNPGTGRNDTATMGDYRTHVERLPSGEWVHKRGGRASGNKTHKFVTEYEASDTEEHRTKAGLLKIADTAYPTRNKRSVWTISTEPYPGSHFAVMPTKLVEPCILADTSARGVCPACGAPWARQTEKEATGKMRQRSTGGLGTAVRREPLGLAAVDGQFQEGVVYHTVGWSPSCRCPAAEPVPATVLDPFLGAGTTALVADRLGRNAVGIELNPVYVGLAAKRLREDGGLFSDVSIDQASVDAQHSLSIPPENDTNGKELSDSQEHGTVNNGKVPDDARLFDL